MSDSESEGNVTGDFVDLLSALAALFGEAFERRNRNRKKLNDD